MWQRQLAPVSGGDVSNLGPSRDVVECNHMLRLEDGAEIVRGRSEWRPKPVNNFYIAN